MMLGASISSVTRSSSGVAPTLIFSGVVFLLEPILHLLNPSLLVFLLLLSDMGVGILYTIGLTFGLYHHDLSKRYLFDYSSALTWWPNGSFQGSNYRLHRACQENDFHLVKVQGLLKNSGKIASTDHKLIYPVLRNLNNFYFLGYGT